MFKVSAKGKETVLYSFQGFLDGGYPGAGLVRDAKGNLYGTTPRFGRFQYGTLFELKGGGNLTVRRSFQQLDGYADATALVMDTAGNFYGALFDGGDYQFQCGGYGCGTAFKFTP